MKLTGKLFRVLGLTTVLATASAGPDLLNAQKEVVPPACEFRTRWMDAFGACPSCCDARNYSCPCTV